MAQQIVTLNIGYKVDLATARITFHDSWSSELAERYGKKSDVVQGRLMVDAINDNGTVWPCVLEVKEMPGKTAPAREKAKMALTTILNNGLAATKAVYGV